jgi:hypothetical protein
MRLAVFGAAGRTGRLVVEQALTAGHEVVAFARDPSRIGVAGDRLLLARGDATDAAAVADAIEGTDAVISAMTTARSIRAMRERPLTLAMRNIIEAMHKLGSRRLVVTSSGVPQPGDEYDYRLALLMGFVRLLIRPAYDDTLGSTQAVRESGLDWTIARMALPNDSPGKGIAKAGCPGRRIGLRISRADAASFLLDAATGDAFLLEAPIVWSKAK